MSDMTIWPAYSGDQREDSLEKLDFIIKDIEQRKLKEEA